jgi:metal-sulfur cluster biosynthetic enzyme
MSAIPAETVWGVLGSILDPEYGISIVDLGLIYSVECAGCDVRVVMTLTTPSCPAGAWIHGGVERALRELPGAGRTEVALTFDPPWSAGMMSDGARQDLGR